MSQPPYNQPPWQQAPPGPPGWGPPGYGPPGYGYPGGYPQPPRKSNAGVIIALVIGAVVLGVAGLVGLGAYIAWRADDPTATTALASDDGKSEIKVPSSWSRRTGLNSVAVLQAGNPQQEEYLIVITDSKDGVAASYPLSTYADLCLEKMKAKISGATITGPNKVKIGDRDGLEYEVAGTIDYLNAHYLITFVDGAKSFHQIMAWTLKAKFAKKRQKFANATATFHEL